MPRMGRKHFGHAYGAGPRPGRVQKAGTVVQVSQADGSRQHIMPISRPASSPSLGNTNVASDGAPLNLVTHQEAGGPMNSRQSLPGMSAPELSLRDNPVSVDLTDPSTYRTGPVPSVRRS